jgi:hypothetical protein
VPDIAACEPQAYHYVPCYAVNTAEESGDLTHADNPHGAAAHDLRVRAPQYPNSCRIRITASGHVCFMCVHELILVCSPMFKVALCLTNILRRLTLTSHAVAGR